MCGVTAPSWNFHRNHVHSFLNDCVYMHLQSPYSCTETSNMTAVPSAQTAEFLVKYVLTSLYFGAHPHEANRNQYECTPKHSSGSGAASDAAQSPSEGRWELSSVSPRLSARRPCWWASSIIYWDTEQKKQLWVVMLLFFFFFSFLEKIPKASAVGRILFHSVSVMIMQ